MANPISSVTLPYQLLLSFALGNAAAPAIRPFAQSLENDAWAAHQVLPPTIYTTAPMAARGKIAVADVQGWAHKQGFSDDVLAALMHGSLVGPDLADLFSMWRRGIIGQDEFELGLTTLGVLPRWVGELEQLKREHLTLEQAANARQQQFIGDAEQRAIAALYGVTPEDADVQFELAGLPPGVETGLAMWRRGIIDQATFERIVAEGHTKTKYTAALEQLRRQLLQPAVAVRAHLKGHIGTDEMHTRGAEWGYSAADMDLWYQAEGRPATAHQIHIGYMRGATLPGAQNERDAINISTAQSDIRPEYEDILYASRETYPSLFQLNRLVQANAITAAVAAEWATKAGVAAEVVRVLETYWQGLSGGAVADPHVSKADTQLWTTLHKAFLGGVATPAEVQQGFTLLGVDAAAQTAILDRWRFEQGIERKRLTPTQVKKALGEAVVNPATGAAWTQDEALAYLIELGYSASDARTFLAI
jgi:hypothetical protein